MEKLDSVHHYIPSRILNHIIPLLLLQFLVTFAQGQGPGENHFSIPENQAQGTFVGTIPVKQYYTYSFQEPQPLFNLDSLSGRITTKVQLDRENKTEIPQNPLNILVIGSQNVGSSHYPIDIHITVLDLNDNAPSFHSPSVNISFNERMNIGTQISLDTATDLDSGENGTVSNYKIISRTDEPDEKFELLYDPNLYGQNILIQLKELLNREERSFYQLTIFVQDQGMPPLNGSLVVNIEVLDSNDNQPIFDKSQYYATMNETAPIGASVMRVEATDLDIGPNGKVSYGLTDSTGQFRIDNDTGEIFTTSTPLNCRGQCDGSASDFNCDSNSCILTVQARDGGIPSYSGRTFILVKINDENDHSPNISIKYQPNGNQNFSTVNEDAKNGDLVASFTVTDKDNGTYGQISSVQIIDGNQHGHFRLESLLFFKYNLIKVNGDKILDRERVSMYNLTIRALDQGIPPKVSTSHLIIYINDVNDHHPMFLKSEYSVSLSETTPPGSYVSSLTAVDLDSGENAKLTYNIIAGNELGWFQIDEVSGLMTVRSQLHFHTASRIIMNVSVHDGSLNPLYNHTKVIVSIWDENDMTPTFSQNQYDVTIDETLAKGSRVVTLKAVDDDTGANGTVVYEFHPDVEQMYQNTFQVDYRLGIITLQSELDRETRSSYILKLIAKDQGQPSKSSTTTVNVIIRDVNDNKPVFYPQEYFANVLENQPSGTSVITVTAKDADVGNNAKVTYRWDGTFPGFSIDQSSGLITTTQSFDGETKISYILRVKCSDPSYDSTNVAVVKVNIVEETDEAPTFQNLPYHFNVTEDADNKQVSLGRHVGTVHATTIDLQTQIVFSIIDGDPENVFLLDRTTGDITTQKKIDREEKYSYLLLVVAIGGAKYSEIYVNISVKDVNDNVPTFTKSSAEAYVVENWSVGHEIFLASATDLDVGLNSDLTYSFLSSTDYFDISVTTGMVYLKKPIGKSSPKSFSLNIMAQDSGISRLSSSLSLHLTVKDVNDHAPKFTHSSYEISLTESVTVNEQFYSLTATDADIGRNAEITYNITRGNFDKQFGIFPNGHLYVARKLDREQKDHYQIVVMAKDNGMEPRSSLVNVTIHILDDNDNSPMFVNISYKFYVPENQVPGQILGSVSAVDKDIGRNAEVSYFLATDNENFAIDSQTGEISTLKTFDREKLVKDTGSNVYIFDAMVTDNGLTKLQSKVKITVYISDENDNEPKFSQKSNIYKATVKEDAPIFTPILKVIATDEDTGENAALSYMIKSGNDDSKFDINPGNGQITLNGSLDREAQDGYVLQVIVTDSGKVEKLSATCTVSITVIDINDNYPLFDQSSYLPVILESTSPGTEIAQLVATDVDLGINSEILYSFSRQDIVQKFNIDENTGKVYLLQDLDYEVKHQYDLTVLASDKGTPELSSEATLVIKLSDTNDNAPRFVNTSSTVWIRENIAPFSNVIKVTAVDPDSGQNGQILYEIKNQDPQGEHFRIGGSGQIFVGNDVQIDREKVALYNLTVIAKDNAAIVSDRKSVEMVITVYIQDENDNSPHFRSSEAIIINYPSQQGHVTTIEAEDKDSGDNGQVVYELTTGDRNLFSLESGTGKFYLRNNVPQSPITYTITVTASDRGVSPRKTTMSFTIILLPQSGLQPTFLNTPITGNIRENENEGITVLQVQARSVVVNSPLDYYIVSVIAEISNIGRYLKINQQSGEVSTVESLDQEIVGSKLNVTVCVVERSSSEPKAKITQLIITILDENDTPPKFTKGLYDSTVPENGPVGATVAQVLVSDADITGQVSLGFQSGNDGSFQINQQGYITTTRSLNREEKAEHELVVRASDGINNAYTTVRIRVQDLNDNPPEFSRTVYSFDILESTAKGTTVGRVDARDDDLGVGGNVVYSLVSQWGSDVFQLDTHDGTFKLIQEVDFELYPLYTLTVSATDGGSPPLSSNTTVYMNIKDTNDNTPLFDLGSYSAEIAENVAIGTSIITISATDLDSGNGGKVHYTIIDGDLHHQFSIGKENGSIYTIKSLDREMLSSYVLVVMAIDQAESPSDRHSATTQVTVNITDVNDEYPIFITPSTVHVPENLPLDYLAFKVKAVDKDVGLNSVVTYSMVPHPSNPFRVRSTSGEVLVNTVLDRESVQNYTIQIVASDSGSPQKSTVQVLNVLIQDVNDNSPVFEQLSYDVTVAENINVSLGLPLVKVKATDADSGLNGIVRYFIIGGDENFDFSMDQSSGVLRVQKNLDYERKKFYKLEIQAEDGGIQARSSTATITINILDYNDNEPVFVDSPYYAHVIENMESLPVYVTKVTAHDDDSLSNSQVVYNIIRGIDENHHDLFKINSSTGEIKCHRKLDREAVPQYNLVVTATDSGVPRKTGSGTVIVMVDDVNDHTPQFDHGGTYVGHVTENNAPDQTVLTVSATDNDIGKNSHVTYLLEGSDKFTIDSNLGVISAKVKLDREERDHYNLVVVARDNGAIPKSASSAVILMVDDLNDNVPQFERPNYNRVIYNQEQSGTFVIGVTALDKDIGDNGLVVYSLTGSDCSQFQINQSTGIITRQITLTRSRYSCIVTARDRGSPQLSSTATVVVEVSTSSSSNRPVFSTIPSNINVNENQQLGHVVTTIRATASGQVIKYYIAGGNVGHAFTIDDVTGVLKVNSIIDYEMTTIFYLWIEARIGSSQESSTFEEVVINVIDENDNTPRFGKPLYNENIQETIMATLLSVSATDPDGGQNGDIVYKLVSGNTADAFTINSQTGEIKTRTKLDREILDSYDLVVEAVDQGQQPRTGTATVRVIVLDVNDNPPVFSRQFSIKIMEDIDVGSFVIQVTSSDADIGDNARVTYSLVDDANGRFIIDGSSGNVSVIAKLDAETMVDVSLGLKYYQLTIAATDSAFDVQTKVFVFVKDVNDNNPQFIEPLSFDFPERQTPGTFVGTVSAVDADFSAPNNQVYYSLKIPSTQFKLNPNNGTITSLAEISYAHSESKLETLNRKELIVIATDFGTPPKSSETVIKINIIDANDHAPIFEKESYFSAVPENAGLGDVIITVMARDDFDFGINAEIEYGFSGGNGTGLFRIDSDNGQISVASSLVGRQNQKYILNVEASDKGSPPQKTIRPVQLTVTDVNRYAPVFVSNTFQATVPEDAAVGHSVATLSARDDDLSGPNGIVKYYIVDGDPQNLFQIDEVRGYLTVHKQLDFDTLPVHRLNITVRDQGLLFKQVSAIFTLQLTDVNDNDPVFNQSRFNVFVPENSPINHPITKITATDKDTGLNAVIVYSLADSSLSSMFSIDQNTGVIRTQGSLDFETKQSYSIIVMAINPGSDKKSTTEVIIHLTGVNEYIPKFAQSSYSFSIKESAATGHVVGTVMATDQDHGEDGKVFYFLIGSSNLKGFKILPKSGQIVVSGKPDYESSPQIVLEVMAKNWGSVKGNDTDQCQVRISVQDANDPPVFSKSEYSANVKEGSRGGVTVIQVTATDNDHKPQDKQFSYAILEGDGDYLFQIDASTGLIQTTGVGILDRENVPVYNITVGAIDTGTPSETGSALVRIYLDDVNDNGPIFVSQNLIGYVKENQPIGTSVMKLSEHTTDPDLPPNQGPYTYTAVSGNHNNFFDVIGSEGLVRTKVSIDREVTPEFTVPIIVSDNGNPTKSSTLSFTIRILDINDSPPTARSLTVVTFVYDQTYFQGTIADVRPLDQDTEGSYTCKILEGDKSKFDISSGCHLQLWQVPEAEDYSLRVSGSDGLNNVSYFVNVEFRHIDDNTLRNSVILRIKNISPEHFMEYKFSLLKDGVTSLFISGQKVDIFNIQMLDSDILVYMSVRQSGGGYVLYDILKSEILTNKATLQINLGIVISDIGYSVCTPSLCGQGECLHRVAVNNSFHFVDSSALVITSPDLYLDYECKCPPEASGKHCEGIVSPCSQGRYCENGGTCVTDSLRRKVCECPVGWNGQYCEVDRNECSQSPCKNNASCQNSLGSYTCICQDGFTGQNCEIGSDHCATRPCLNNGNCQNEVDGFRCKCPFSYWGPTCQFTSVGFNEGSFMEFDSMAEYDNVIDVTFSTIKTDALLLYNPSAVGDSKEFIALEIVNGNIRFSYRLDYSQVTRLTVAKDVATGEWIRVQVHRNRKIATVRVSECPGNGEPCDECQIGNKNCYADGVQESEQLNLGGHKLSIGGIQNISTILIRPGQIATHDFIGCIRNFTINNKDMIKETPSSQKDITFDSCPRKQSQSGCNDNSCLNGGGCVDDWSDTSCICADGYTGAECQYDVKPLQFGGENSKVTYTQRESYNRDHLLKQMLGNRKRRSVTESSIMVRFRTTVKKGILAFVSTKDTYGVLWINSNSLIYSTLIYSTVDMKTGNKNSMEIAAAISDGKWHNATILVDGNLKVSLGIDNTFAEEEALEGAFLFSSIEVTKIILGDMPSSESNRFDVEGLNGCISRFELDKLNLPTDGKTDRFDIARSENIGEKGCKQLCDGRSDCPDCSPEDEEVKCGPISPPPEPLGIGVIVVIVFFGVLIIVIVIVFIIFRIRGQYPCKAKSASGDPKANGNGHINKSFCNSSGHSHQDSGFGEVHDEGEIINTHIANRLLGKSYETPNGGLVKPDIINADLQQRKFPLQMDDGTVIIDNGDVIHMNNLNEDMPEHYDLENASSIAPSDIDVVTHYRGFRDGKGHSYGKVSPYHVSNIDRHHKHNSKHRHSPANYPGGPGYNNGLPSLQNTAINRQSPAFALDPHLHNSSRNSPASMGHRQSPLHQINRQSPQVRASPLVHNGGHMQRRTPDIHHSRTDSEHSLASHHGGSHHGSHLSHSSSSSVPLPRTAVLPNGHVKHGRQKGNIPNGKVNHGVKGLTLDEVKILNSRQQGRSPVSMLEAVSSSSEGRHHRNMQSEQLSNGVVLEPPISSSSDSANDSFTCSEFEYENDRVRNDIEPGAMIFSKLAEVENETDDSPVHKRSKSTDGRGSNGDSFSSNCASSEEGQQGKILNGTFNWDYLLNWGPSFEKLVGVFKDIASLPDGEENPNNNSNVRNECEEYV